MNTIVRQINESDIVGYKTALNRIILEKKYLLLTDTLSLKHATDYVTSAITRNHTQYVAESAEEIIGFADIIPKQKGSARHTGELGMGVVAEWRGQGIGSALLESAIQHSWDNNLTRLELEVFASNLKAISLYERYGFVHEGRKRNARFVDGQYEDVIVMGQCRL